jgi:hypothetical protein
MIGAIAGTSSAMLIVSCLLTSVFSMTIAIQIRGNAMVVCTHPGATAHLVHVLYQLRAVFRAAPAIQWIVFLYAFSAATLLAASAIGVFLTTAKIFPVPDKAFLICDALNPTGSTVAFLA